MPQLAKAASLRCCGSARFSGRPSCQRNHRQIVFKSSCGRCFCFCNFTKADLSFFDESTPLDARCRCLLCGAINCFIHPLLLKDVSVRLPARVAVNAKTRPKSYDPASAQMVSSGFMRSPTLTDGSGRDPAMARTQWRGKCSCFDARLCGGF